MYEYGRLGGSLGLRKKGQFISGFGGFGLRVSLHVSWARTMKSEMSSDGGLLSGPSQSGILSLVNVLLKLVVTPQRPTLSDLRVAKYMCCPDGLAM